MDLGASVVELEDGRIEVELGEDETGHLVALVLEQEHYHRGDDMELTLMLLPEGTELPSSGQDLPEYPDTDVNGEPFEQNDPGFWYPDDLAAYFGGTVLGEWHLGWVSYSTESSDDGTDAPRYHESQVEPEFVSNAPISGLYVSGESGNGLWYYGFLHEPDLSRLDGISAVEGTDEADVLTPEGVSFVDGHAGDDYINAPGAEAKGGEGNDTIIGDSWFNSGEEGDDLLIVDGSSPSAWGGSGNDTIIGGGGPNILLKGDAGDDTLIAVSDVRLAGDQYVSREPGLNGSDTFMVSDQGVGDTSSDAPIRLSSIDDFNSSVDQLVILTRDGNEPVSVVYEPRYYGEKSPYSLGSMGGHLTLTYDNGSVGLIHMDEVDAASVIFRDLDDVLAIYAAESDPPVT